MDLVIAIVGGLVGGTIAAVVTGWFTLRAQGREFEHREKMARAERAAERAATREDRLQQRRAGPYERMLAHVFRVTLWVERTEPVFGPKPPPPEPTPEEDLIALEAQTTAHATHEVQELVRNLGTLARRFEFAVARLQTERSTGRASPDAMTAWQEVEAAREKYREADRVLGDRVNAELRGDA